MDIGLDIGLDIGPEFIEGGLALVLCWALAYLNYRLTLRKIEDLTADRIILRHIISGLLVLAGLLIFLGMSGLVGTPTDVAVPETGPSRPRRTR